MDETAEDLAELQRQLDDSYAAAGEHLRSIFSPDRRASASDVVAKLTGVFLINLATVTARGEPIAAPLDGLFYRGRLWFGLPPGSRRAGHLHARPHASATYNEGDGATCLLVHGTAIEVGDGHPLFEGFDRYARALYGPTAIDFAKARYGARTAPGFSGYIEPKRIYAHAFPKA